MITLAQVRDWLRTQVTSPAWYIGKIDGSKEECIGLYNVQGPRPNLAIGGLDNATYTTKTISVLVHWGKNADLAEQKALEVYAALIGKTGITIGGRRVVMIQMRTPEPVSVGTDERNIYEYVIEAHIFYER